MAAVVTGAGSGIGKALAILLAANGTKVFGVDKNAEAVNAVNGITPVVADVGTAEGVDAITKAVGSEAVKNLVLVGGSMINKPLLGMDRASYDAMVGTEVMAPIFVTQGLLANLRTAGGARIILTSGGSPDAYIPTFGAYGSTKAALKTLWLALRDECAEFAGVALANPGLVKTPLWDPYLADPNWQFKSLYGPRLEGEDCHTAEEVAEWMAAMCDPNKADSETFKIREWVIDNPDHRLGVKVRETTESKAIQSKA